MFHESYKMSEGIRYDNNNSVVTMAFDKNICNHGHHVGIVLASLASSLKIKAYAN